MDNEFVERMQEEANKSCRFCHEGFEGREQVKTRTYWHGSKHIQYYSHPECKEEGESFEAYECQTIDADCNDCKHFARGKKISKSGGGVWEGFCKKLNKETRAYPNFCTGHECFEHRRASGHGQ